MARGSRAAVCKALSWVGIYVLVKVTLRFEARVVELAKRNDGEYRSAPSYRLWRHKFRAKCLLLCSTPDGYRGKPVRKSG